MTVVELTGTDFKKIYFPKYREFQDVTEDTVKDAKRCSDTFHDFLVNSRVLGFMIMICLVFISRRKDV
ncbi:MAG: hypothetical protein ACTINQ_02565 [Leuconostoc mesenteroides]